MKKRILSAALVLCMLVCLCVPAMAASASVTGITPNEVIIHRGDVIQLAAITSPAGNTNVDWWVRDNSIVSVGSVDRWGDFYAVNPDYSGYYTDSSGRYYYYDADGNKVYVNNNYDPYYNGYGNYLDYNYYYYSGTKWIYVDNNGSLSNAPRDDYDYNSNYIYQNVSGESRYYPRDYYNHWYGYDYGYGYNNRYADVKYYYEGSNGQWYFVDVDGDSTPVSRPSDLYSSDYIKLDFSYGHSPRYYSRDYWGSWSNYDYNYNPYYDDYNNSASYQRGRATISIRGENLGTTEITASIDGGRAITCTVTVVEEDAYIDSDYYAIDVTPFEHGNVSPKGKVYVKAGERQTFTALPDSGYEVDRVLVDGTKEIPVDGNQFSITANTPYSVHVTFRKVGTASSGNQSTGDISVQPVTPPTTSTPSTPSTPPQTTTPPTKNPNTGDTAPVSLAAVILLAGGALAVCSRKLRK